MKKKNLMKPDDRIYVAGHNGPVGSAIPRAVEAAGYTNVITRYGTIYLAAMPSNLDDLEDNFGIHNSRVRSALMRKTAVAASMASENMMPALPCKSKSEPVEWRSSDRVSGSIRDSS